MKAAFVRRPSDSSNKKVDQLYKIRPYRKITPQDLQEIYPEWEVKGDFTGPKTAWYPKKTSEIKDSHGNEL